MKMHAPRTDKWIKRNLPAYVRANKNRSAMNTYDLLSLVLHEKRPSVAMIQNWTPIQKMLAEDWAYRVHLRASDNIIHVPAKPDFLKPYS